VLLICNVAAICTVAYTKGYRHLVQLRKQHAAASTDAEQLAVSAISDIAVLAAVVTAAAALAAAASGLWVS
jgi:glutathione peroxidase-family protein